MALHFLPRDRTFWCCHLGASLFTAAISLVTVYLWGRLESLYIASTFVWLVPYTAAVLGFRWIYQARGWHALPMTRLIPVAIAYSTLAALLVVAAVQAMVLPLYWQDVIDSHRAAGIPFVAHQYIVRRVIGDGLQGQLFVAAWIFIYVAVSSSRRIRQAELANLQLQNSLKEAQLSTLSNQLNPHFLFNALNNTRFMIHESAQNADAMLVGLSEMLRYSLESSRRETVRLGEELEVVSQYVRLMKSQLEDRLRVVMDVPTTLHGYRIPPMVLQMLVENAIKHGIDPLQQGGELRVDSYGTDDMLSLTVTNDAPTGPLQPRDGTGTGLRNIRSRLRLLYGERAGLEVQPGTSQFRVTLTLPKDIAR